MDAHHRFGNPLNLGCAIKLSITPIKSHHRKRDANSEGVTEENLFVEEQIVGGHYEQKR
jgi:hypothetical protein